MWVVDTRDGMLLDTTPFTHSFLETIDTSDYLSTVTRAEHAEHNKQVVQSGESATVLEWAKVNGRWRKLARSKSYAGSERVLEMSHDCTGLDPRAPWLARINLADQRLELENGESISFDEFVVLNMLLKGYQHKRISNMLHISPKTVEYRIARLKSALGAASSEAMMLEVSSSGLIYLAVTPIDFERPAQNELELYKNVPG